MVAKSTTKSSVTAPPCCRYTAKDYLSWKDPVASGKAFGSILATLLIFKYTDVIGWFFYLTAIVLSLSALAEYVGRWATGEGFVTKVKPAYHTAIGDFLETHAQILAKAFKDAEIQLQDILTSVDIETTLKVALASYVLYKLTSFLSVWTILFTSTILAFTLPAIYTANKKLIDSTVVKYSDVAKEKSVEAYKTAKAKAEPTLKKIEAKLAPITKFIKEKIPVRTAGSTVKATPSVPEKPPKATEIKKQTSDIASSISQSVKSSEPLKSTKSTVSTAESSLKQAAEKTASKLEGESEPLLN